MMKLHFLFSFRLAFNVGLVAIGGASHVQVFEIERHSVENNVRHYIAPTIQNGANIAI